MTSIIATVIAKSYKLHANSFDNPSLQSILDNPCYNEVFKLLDPTYG